MKMGKSKKIFLIFLLVIFLIFIFGSFVIAAKLEVEYPQVEGAETPKTVKTFFPKYIHYLFNLSIIIAGLVAFASLVYGGVRYLTSAGSPIAMADAKSQITAGILGLIILLASYLLLITINPQLTVLTVGKFEYEKGVILYTNLSCQQGGEEGKEFLRVRRSLSSLEDLNNKVQSIYFYNSGDELEVYIYPEEGFGGTPSFISKDQKVGDCLTVGGLAKSIILYWKIPGVYLFEKENFDTPPEPRLFVADSGDFGDFNDKANSLKIMPFKEKYCDIGPGASLPPCQRATNCEGPNSGCLNEEVASKFGAILHENSNFEGDAQVFFGDEPSLNAAGCPNSWPGPYCKESVGSKASSITIFKQNLYGNASGDGVTLYGNYDFNEEEGGKPEENKVCGPFKPEGRFPLWVDENNSEYDCADVLGKKYGSSIKVDGNFIAVLFREDGRGEVFKPPGDLRLKDNHIGDNEARYMLVIPVAKD